MRAWAKSINTGFLTEAIMSQDPDAALEAMHVHLERLSVAIVGTADMAKG
jgi:hypothetical protein